MDNTTAVLTFDRGKTIKRMNIVIPALILCMIGDYCIGAEPRGSETLGGIASSGWLTISDLRIGISNLFGAIGSVMYAIGAVEFVKYLLIMAKAMQRKADRIWTYLYTSGLGIGCVSFMYFHISCGELIHHFNVLYEVTGGDIQKTTDAWTRLFMTEAVPYILFFTVFDALTTVAWAVLIWRRILPVSRWWIPAAPLVMAGIGTVLEIVPLPFSGINSGFESLGWMLMFICGIRYIRSEPDRNIDL